MWARLMQGGAAVNWIPVNASLAVPHSNEVEAQNDRISPSWRQVTAMLLSEKFYFRRSLITSFSSSCRVFNVEVGCRHLKKSSQHILRIDSEGIYINFTIHLQYGRCEYAHRKLLRQSRFPPTVHRKLINCSWFERLFVY
jgi:hypothetical protein